MCETFAVKPSRAVAVRLLVERLVYPRIHGLCFDQLRGQDVLSRRDARCYTLQPPRLCLYCCREFYA